MAACQVLRTVRLRPAVCQVLVVVLLAGPGQGCRTAGQSEAEQDAAAYAMQAGLRRLNDQQFEDAIADFTTVVRLEPSNAAAYEKRAQAYEALGDKVRAEADRDRVEMLELEQDIQADVQRQLVLQFWLLPLLLIGGTALVIVWVGVRIVNRWRDAKAPEFDIDEMDRGSR